MTRRGYQRGSAARTAIVAISLVVGATLALGPAVPSSLVAFAGEAAASIAPGAAPAAPGPLLDASTTTSTTYVAATTTDTTTTDTTTVVTTTVATTTSTTATSTSSLPANVLDENGGTVVLGHVDLTLKPGALQARTRFSIAGASGPDYAGIPPVEAFALGATSLMTKADVTGFGVPAQLAVHTDALDLSGIDAASLRIAELDQGGSWRVLPTAYTADVLYAWIDAPGTYGVVGRPSAPHVTLTLATDAPAAGLHRVDPGATVKVTLTGVADGPITNGTVYLDVPGDWTVEDADGGTPDPGSGALTWDAKDGSASFTHAVTLKAPAIADDAAQYAYTGTFTAHIVQKRSPVYRADATSVLVAPRLVIQHRVMAKVDSTSRQPAYGARDAALDDAGKFTVYRVRFRIQNPDTVPVTLVPQLQYADPAASATVPGAPGPGESWVTLPGADDPLGTAKFHVATESADSKRGTESIDESGARTGDGGLAASGSGGLHSAAGGGAFVRGVHSLGVNPLPALTIDADGWTEVEFSVRATVWADWSTDYALRLTDAGTAYAPTASATIRMGPNPEPGTAPGAPGATSPAGRGTVIDTGLVAYPLQGSGVTAAALKAAADSVPQHIHADMSLTTDTCAICHLGHWAPNPNLTNDVAATWPAAAKGQLAAAGTLSLAADAPAMDDPGTAMCMVCHNGTGAPLDSSAAWGKAPANDPATAAYYRHDTASTGIDATVDPHAEQFKGVLDRRSTCIDCHNPHSPSLNTNAPSTETPNGWTASGAEGLASAVRVTNGAAGAAPTYTWLDMPPATSEKIQYEYELCFKCHSSYTKLPDRDPQHPSWAALDTAAEFNPANVSYHPVEAKGTNQSTYIDCSLSGGCTGVTETNPYRLWKTFTSQSTVRCAQCHGALPPDTGPVGKPGDPALPQPSPGADLALHASQNRGLLIQPYRDRVVKTAGEDLTKLADLGEFALCFSCHSTAPFTAVAGNRRDDTAFGIHGNHMLALATSINPGTCKDADIDHAAGRDPGNQSCTDASGNLVGAGSGNAICAECHFRTHSTQAKVGDQGTYTGLVNFAPDVTGVDGKPLDSRAWLKSVSDPQGGSCTLTCHGKVHIDVRY